MGFNEKFEEVHNLIRTYVYIPFGLTTVIVKSSKFFDSKEGNETLDGLCLAIGAYFLVKGVTGAVYMLRQKNGLEKKIE